MFRCFSSCHNTAHFKSKAGTCDERSLLLPSNLRVLMVSLVPRERLVTLDPRETLVLPDQLDLSELLVLR